MWTAKTSTAITKVFPIATGSLENSAKRVHAAFISTAAVYDIYGENKFIQEKNRNVVFPTVHEWEILCTKWGKKL